LERASFLCCGLGAWRSRSPSPRPSPQGEGEPLDTTRIIRGLMTFARGPIRAPSPRGEGRGKGDRDALQPIPPTETKYALDTFIGRDLWRKGWECPTNRSREAGTPIGRSIPRL